MRAFVLVATVSALACESRPGPAPEGSGISPTGFYHLPTGAIAATLSLQPDGIARFFVDQCDSMERSQTHWRSTSSSTVELTLGSSTSVLTFEDGRVAIAEPPLLPLWGPAPEIWQPGAVCSVCTPGLPFAVVRCQNPDALEAECCAGTCGGAVRVSPSCKPALVLGEPGNAAAPWTCTCPAGSVPASECTAYPKVFCGGE